MMFNIHYDTRLSILNGCEIFGDEFVDVPLEHIPVELRNAISEITPVKSGIPLVSEIYDLRFPPTDKVYPPCPVIGRQPMDDHVAGVSEFLKWQAECMKKKSGTDG